MADTRTVRMMTIADNLDSEGSYTSATSVRAITAQRDKLARAIEVVEKHRRHVEQSPGVGNDVQSYAIAVCQDIIADLQRDDIRDEPRGDSREARMTMESFYRDRLAGATHLLQDIVDRHLLPAYTDIKVRAFLGNPESKPQSHEPHAAGDSAK